MPSRVRKSITPNLKLGVAQKIKHLFMHMRIEPSYLDYFEGLNEIRMFSLFNKSMHNYIPYKAVTLIDVYGHIKDQSQKQATSTFRSESNYNNETYLYSNFSSCTFSGLFRKKGEDALISHSSLMCIGFNNVEDPESLKYKLINNGLFETELMFTDVSGKGIKWVIPVDLTESCHSEYFELVTKCIKKLNLPPADQLGCKVDYSCYLPYDPNAFINPKYNIYVNENIFSERIDGCPF